jgi:hypothetical protein
MMGTESTMSKILLALIYKLDDAEKLNELVVERGHFSNPYTDGLRAGFGDARAVIEKEWQRVKDGTE